VGILLAVVVLAGLLVPVGLLRLAERIPGAVSEPLEEDPFAGIISEDLIRRRLEALADELERLEHDREVFARAFHTSVARAAYETLLADAAQLAEQTRRVAAGTLEFELLEPSVTGPVEELEL
jgi:hypothetical protein